PSPRRLDGAPPPAEGPAHLLRSPRTTRRRALPRPRSRRRVRSAPASCDSFPQSMSIIYFNRLEGVADNVPERVRPDAARRMGELGPAWRTALGCPLPRRRRDTPSDLAAPAGDPAARAAGAWRRGARTVVGPHRSAARRRVHGG